MGSSEEVTHYFPKNDGAEKSAPLSDSELLQRLCPDYLAMGMSLDEYWNGDAELPRYYREAHRLKRQQANTDAWLHGFYVYQALERVSPLFRDWVKDHHPEKYMLEPLDLYPKKNEVSTEQQQTDAKELANQEYIKAWAKRVNRLKAEKEGGVTNG